jgi:nifR3 family TIM-barrel protein
MQKGFWEKLPRPFFALAPMAQVTDAAFRRVIARYGKPDVMWTEFVSCDGLCSVGREVLLVDLWFHESERPLVAQIFGSTPENFYRTALLIQELGFDGIDINMGCPDRNVEKQGAGAALMKDPRLAQKIIRETKRGAGPLPVSVKTRLGFSRVDIEGWLPYLLDADIAALTIHGRTRKEMSKVPAHWDEIARAVNFIHAYDSSSNRPIVIGNGDVATRAEAEERISQSRVDGVMIGRGIFGNPWLFQDGTAIEPRIDERLMVMLEHTRMFEELFGERKNFDIMKKHYKAYVNGFAGAKELRVELMGAKNAAEVASIIERVCSTVLKQK